MSTVLYFIFYHPPVFHELHNKRSKWQEVKDIDIGGVILFLAGFVLLLLGYVLNDRTALSFHDLFSWGVLPLK